MRVDHQIWTYEICKPSELQLPVLVVSKGWNDNTLFCYVCLFACAAVKASCHGIHPVATPKSF